VENEQTRETDAMSTNENGLDAIKGVRTYAPGSDGYKQATSPRNSSATQHPLLVAAPTSIGQVAAAVRHAAAHDLRVVPQATGHGAASELGADVLLLDTSRLNAIQIDADRRIARVGAGATWGAVDSAAEKVGLLGRAGSALDVAVSGFTFGGGAGWLTRPYGLAAGALIAVDFVDGTGHIRRAADDAIDEADRAAIWAYRGGGGVGIATRLEFELAAVDDLWAGYLLWPIDALEAVVSAWARCVPRFGAALATSIAVLRAPSGPPIPRTLQGQQVVHLSMASSRGEGDAAALRQALTAVPAPLLDTLPLPTFWLLERGVEDAVHEGEVGEAQEATPEDGDAGQVAGRTAQEPAQLGDPAHGVSQGRWHGGWLGGLVDGAVERLPLVVIKQRGTGQVGLGAG
jgi:FAD/FMN-containing dehydrogenase